MTKITVLNNVHIGLNIWLINILMLELVIALAKNKQAHFMLFHYKDIHVIKHVNFIKMKLKITSVWNNVQDNIHMQQQDIIQDNVFLNVKLELMPMIIQHLNNVLIIVQSLINIFNKINVKMDVQENLLLL